MRNTHFKKSNKLGSNTLCFSNCAVVLNIAWSGNS